MTRSRSIGLPGDKIEIKEKKVYINNRLLDEPYVQFINGTFSAEEEEFSSIIVPPKQLFLMGDNRDDSADSRHWGTVPLEDVIGRARTIYWSEDQETEEVRWDRIGKIVQ